jgi:predicted phosphodiesterase
MKLAVISDIHGNQAAFEAVLADIDALGISDIVSLGDLVGYGPHPESVVATVRNRGIPTVQGNHDRAVAAPAHLGWFNPEARRSLETTRRMMSEAALHFIGSRPPFLTRNGCRFVHGFPPDSVSTYLFQVRKDQLRSTFQKMAEPRCFVGHTHELTLIGYDGSRPDPLDLSQGEVHLRADHRYIVNIGAVGQPRDGDNRAKYVVYDPDADVLEVRFVAYDIQKTARAIIAAGLPQSHADRLW